MGMHTPGPWATGDGDRESILSSVNWHCVAQANKALEEWPANACLIASAPKLLALLERIRDDMSWRTNDSALWPDMLALIKEATGATP